MEKKWKAWELALLMAVCITLLAGIWAKQEQTALSDKLIRLHVVANSDSEADQRDKLIIRDKALALLAPALRECRTRQQAAEVIIRNIPQLEALGDVAVSLTEEYYPTRVYDTFSLPAGSYLSLRLTVGEGQGHNWWCVVFPPLCTEALADEDTDAFSMLTEDEQALITEDGTAYVIRFRVVELWGRLNGLFS